jgi:mannose-6-phosphate isomerase-like protein (cupin superfamily)
MEETAYVFDLNKLAIKNKNYRKVYDTTEESQIVLMSLFPKEEIGEEVHETNTQIINIVEGEGIAIIEHEKHRFISGSTIIIPSGTLHNIINTGNKALKLYTIYSPPLHKRGLIQKYKPRDDSE